MPTRTDDRELVAQAQAGETEAFAALVDRYRDAVLGVAYHYLGSFEDAQDAAQETFVRAYLHLKELRDPAKFGPWLRRIAATCCAGLLRQRGDRMLSLEDVPEPSSARESEDDRLAARLMVREALSRLPERARLATTLYYINGYSHREIADFLEVSVAAVRSRLSSARKRLREEMITMVSDVLNEGKPGPEFTRQAVEEAMRRAKEAFRAHDRAGGLRHYEEALSILDRMERSPENLRLRMQVLRYKAAGEFHLKGVEATIRTHETALAIARDMGDRREEAECVASLARDHVSPALGDRQKSEELMLQARGLYRELGDAKGQAECLNWVGHLRIEAGDLSGGRRYLAEALPLYEEARELSETVSLRTGLRLLEEIGEKRYPLLRDVWYGCEVLEDKQGALTQTGMRGAGQRLGEIPAAFDVGTRGIFGHFHLNNKFLHPSVAVGGSWTGDVLMMTFFEGVRMTWTVKSNSQRVATPAGAFENCLLMEQTTPKIELTDRTPDFFKEWWPKMFYPRRRFWFAPGVGLVQLRAERGDGAEAVVQLKEFSIVEPSRDYFPLAIGNTWSYQCADTPPGYVTKEFYRVAEHEGDKWYLEEERYILEESG